LVVICAECRFTNPIDGSVNSIRFHDLRHTFGTIAVQAFPLSDVQAYMDHADIHTTML
jgi:integrase